MIDENSIKFKRNSKVQPPNAISRKYREQNYVDQDSPSAIDRILPPAGVKTRLLDMQQSGEVSSGSDTMSPVRVARPLGQIKPQKEFFKQQFSEQNITGLKKKGRVLQPSQENEYSHQYINHNSSSNKDLLDHMKEEQRSRERIAQRQSQVGIRMAHNIFDNVPNFST